MQRPEICPVCVACFCADADDFSSSSGKNILFAELSSEKKNYAGHLASVFFLCKIAHQTKRFCPRMMKNCKHQHKGKPHTLEKSQDVATSMEDAITETVHTIRVETSCVYN